MPLNSRDRDRLLVAVHDGLDAVIGDRVRWKPRGKLSMRQAMAKAGGAKPLVAARKERRLKQARGSKKMTMAREKTFAGSKDWKGESYESGRRPTRKTPLTAPMSPDVRAIRLKERLTGKKLPRAVNPYPSIPAREYIKMSKNFHSQK